MMLGTILLSENFVIISWDETASTFTKNRTKIALFDTGDILIAKNDNYAASKTNWFVDLKKKLKLIWYF